MRIVTPVEKEMYIETAKQLKGHQKRLYMARVVKALGRGGQAYASRELGWDRNTIRKGQRELETARQLAKAEGVRAEEQTRAVRRLPEISRSCHDCRIPACAGMTRGCGDDPE